jgi:hypothetical protein
MALRAFSNQTIASSVRDCSKWDLPARQAPPWIKMKTGAASRGVR